MGIYRFIGILLLLFFCSEHSIGAVTTWNNGNGTNVWNDAGNWSAGVPGTSDIATFNSTSTANCTININASVAGVDIQSNYSGSIVQSGANTVTVGSSDFSMAGGVFVGGTGSIDINGEFQLSGGTFTSTSGTMTIGGTFSSNTTLFTHSGGTFNHNNGEVEFDPYRSSCSTTTYTIDVLTSTAFYDVELNGSQSCGKDARFDTGTDSINATNDLLQTDGYVNGNWEVKNDLYLAAGADGGLGRIIFNGTGAQNYDVASSAARSCIITVQKSAGSVTPAGGTTDFGMQGFELYAGSFTAPTGTMTIGGTFSSNTTLFTHTGGTFNHNNGEVEFDPYRSSCSTTTYTIDVLTSTEFYDVELNGSQSCGKDARFDTGTDSVNATNDLLQTDGYLNGNWEVKNDLYLAAGADGGLGRIIFNGTGAQNYDVASSAARSCIISVDKTAGGVNPSGGTTDFGMQGFELFAGSFTAPTGTMTIGGTFSSNTTLFTHTGGTFNHNNGEVEFDPYRSSCSTTTYTIDVLTSTEFYDVELNGSQSCGKAARFDTGTDSVNASNDLLQTDGYLNGNWEVKNDLYLAAGADGGLGRIIFNGTGAQNYVVASSAARSCIITVDKTAGGVTPSGGTTDFGMQGFELFAGSFTAPTGTMTIGGTFSSNTTLFTHTGGTFTHNNGEVEFDPYRSSCSTTTYTIDVLTSTEFYDVELNGSQSCGKAARFDTGTDSVNATNDLLQTDGYLNGNWEVKNDLYLAAGADGGLGRIIFNGTGAQNYDVASSAARSCIITVDKTAGGVTPAGGTTDFGMQGFELFAGSFTAPTGTMTIGGTFSSNTTLFTHTGGTFTHNNGEVEFDPYRNSCSTTTYNIGVLTSTEFYDVELNGSQSCGKAAQFDTGTDSVNATNDLLQTDGYLNGNWEVKNDLYLAAGADGGLGRIFFNGTGAQNYSVASSAARSPIITVNKSAGSVTPAGGTTDFGMQGFELSAGSFTAPTGTMIIGGTFSANTTLFTHSSGTFVHNNGKVEFDPYRNSCSNTTYTIDVHTSTLFYDLEFDGSQSCGKSGRFSSGSDSIAISNVLTLTNGSFITGYLEAFGAVTVTSTYDGGAGALIFAGSGTQLFDLTSATSNYDGNILLIKPNNTDSVRLLSDLILDGSSQQFRAISGVLRTSATNTVYFGDGTSAIADSGFVSGFVYKAGNDAFTFPIGANGASAYLSISAPSSATDTFRAQYHYVNPDDDGFDPTSMESGLEQISTVEYWTLDRVSGSSSVSATLSWRAYSGVSQLSDLRVARWNSGTSEWENHGNAATSGSSSVGNITSNTISSFSPFTLASTSNSNVLPVELLTFSAKRLASSVELNWSTSTEVNNDYFEVQRSSDLTHWENIGQVAGMGNSRSLVQYELEDRFPLKTVAYYRLRQVDFDGHYEFSKTVQIDPIETLTSVGQIRPLTNPVLKSQDVLIMLSGFSNQRVELRCFDLSGRMLVQQQVFISEGTELLNLNSLRQYSSGTYLITIATPHQMLSTQVTIH